MRNGAFTTGAVINFQPNAATFLDTVVLGLVADMKFDSSLLTVYR